MANPFDQFDSAPTISASNPFDQFDEQPKAVGTDAANAPGPSRVGVFARGAEEGALPAAGGLVGFGAGAAAANALGLPAVAAMTGPAAPIVEGAGTLLAGGAGAYFGAEKVGEAQKWALEHMPPEFVKALGLDASTQAADEAAHPNYRFAGELAPNLAAFRPGAVAADLVDSGAKTITQKLMANPVTARALPAAVMGAQEAANEEIQKGDLDPSKIAIAAGVGALSNKPTTIGRFLTAAGEGPVLGLAASLRKRGQGGDAGPDFANMQDITPKGGTSTAAADTLKLPAPIDPQDIHPGDAESPIDTATIAAGRKIIREATTPLSEHPENPDILAANGWPAAGSRVTLNDGETPPVAGVVHSGIETAHPDTGIVGQGINVALDSGPMFTAFRHEIDAAGISITPELAQEAGLPPTIATPAPALDQSAPAEPATVSATQSPPLLAAADTPADQSAPQIAPAKEVPVDLFQNQSTSAAPEISPAAAPVQSEPVAALAPPQSDAIPSSVGDGTQASPIVVTHPDHLEAARDVVNTDTTPAQDEAGNFQSGHVKISGLDITIQKPVGAVRTGTGPDGKTWESPPLVADYGHIKGTKSADGEPVDVFVGPNPTSSHVYVIDQHNAETGAYDESKAMLGFNSRDEAVNAYRSAFSDGKADQRIGGITDLNTVQFKQMLKSGAMAKPLTADKEIISPGTRSKGMFAPEADAPTEIKYTDLAPQGGHDVRGPDDVSDEPIPARSDNERNGASLSRQPDDHQPAIDNAWDTLISSTAKKLGWNGEPNSAAMYRAAMLAPKGEAKTALNRSAGIIKTMEDQRADPLRFGTTPNIGTGETKIRGAAQGAADKAAKSGHTIEDLPTYDASEQAPLMERARKFVANDATYEQAQAVAMGHEPAPYGQNAVSMRIAVEERAMKEGDFGLLNRVATQSKLNEEATISGQNNAMYAQRDPHSAAAAIQEVSNARKTVANKDTPKAKKDAVKEMLREANKRPDASVGEKKLKLQQFISAVVCKE